MTLVRQILLLLCVTGEETEAQSNSKMVVVWSEFGPRKSGSRAHVFIRVTCHPSL